MPPLKYVYMNTMPDAPRGGEVGILLDMDQYDDEFVKDPKGRWGPERWRAMFAEEDGFDLSWATKAINALIRKGWVEATAWGGPSLSPVRVRRTEKPGLSPP